MFIHPTLKPYLKSIEVELFNTNSAPRILPYRVLPDLSVVMGFQYSGSIYILEQEKKRRLEHCGISGLQTQHKIFQLENFQTKTILVKFYPWAINAFFNEDAYHFTNQAVGLSEVLGSSSILCLEEQLATTIEPDRLSGIVQTFLLDLLTSNNKKKLPPNHIVALAKHLSCFKRVDSIATLARNYGVSIRNLERQFKSALGVSPKKFLCLSQFQKSIRHLLNGANWEQTIEHLNYYDQSHFINRFKQFSGLTPSQFITSHT